MVNYADEIPSFLVAVDVFLWPEGAEWLNWDVIIPWNKERIGSHPWARHSLVVQTEYKGLLFCLLGANKVGRMLAQDRFLRKGHSPQMP